MRVCLDCSGPVTRKSTTGRCRPCTARRINADPAIQARRKQRIREVLEDPDMLARRVETMRRNNAKWRATPEGAATMRELGRNARRYAQTPEARAKWLAGRAASGAKRTETVMAWCPADWRDRYFHLVRTKRMLADDARALVLSEIKQEKTRLIVARHFEEIRHFLTKFAPVIRKDDGWLYGTATFSAERLAERAMAKGWRPCSMSAGIGL